APGQPQPDDRLRQRVLAEAKQRLRELGALAGGAPRADSAPLSGSAQQSASPASAGSLSRADSAPLADSAQQAAPPSSAGSLPRADSAPLVGSAQQPVPASTNGSGPRFADDLAACGVLLGFAYPDRIGRRRAPGRYTLSGGRGAQIAEGQTLAQAEYLVVAELDDQGVEGRIQLAAALSEGDLQTYFADAIRTVQTVEWDAEAEAVRARQSRRIGAVVLWEGPAGAPDPDRVAAALFAGIRQAGLGILPWTRAARQLQERVLFLRRHEPEGGWPDVSDEALVDTLEEWLAPYVGGMRKRADLARLNLTSVLESMLIWELRGALDREAPTHLTVPSGSRLPIDYADPEFPALAVRLQEMFGRPDTPRIAKGRVPLTLHLLSPAQRPVQVTKDLASFWRSAYFEVRKDLKGRYPKHYWPDDPLEAQATRRVRPPGTPN
ncbi:ATP-dependent helicase C-terminal domain-containing protein, partial [Cohnella sp. REN36]|uniref:ATP-dependent helicase C-terminal domain-containing protein n=1 Tax=Cohnella sp. REN36 TaxID=2887347 RepID=UPI0027147D03